MKILGISLGTKNGNNDTMCRVALEEAQRLGAEIEFIHLFDWDIDYCTGCVACSVGLVMGKGMICSRRDDYKALYEKMIDADGVLFVDPIFESGASLSRVRNLSRRSISDRRPSPSSPSAALTGL